MTRLSSSSHTSHSRLSSSSSTSPAPRPSRQTISSQGGNSEQLKDDDDSSHSSRRNSQREEKPTAVDSGNSKRPSQGLDAFESSAMSRSRDLRSAAELRRSASPISRTIVPTNAASRTANDKSITLPTQRDKVSIGLGRPTRTSGVTPSHRRLTFSDPEESAPSSRSPAIRTDHSSSLILSSGENPLISKPHWDMEGTHFRAHYREHGAALSYKTAEEYHNAAIILMNEHLSEAVQAYVRRTSLTNPNRPAENRRIGDVLRYRRSTGELAVAFEHYT